MANLGMRAMTLRGVGSYLHGARLEFRPLTILCGTNGSGKSTWLNVLARLRTLSCDGDLPFGYHDTPDLQNIEFANAFLACWADCEDSRFDFIRDKDAEQEFGPPFTVGLEFEAVRDFAFHVPAECEATEIMPSQQLLLYQGRCQKGTRFRLRLAHPTYPDRAVDVPGLYHLVELQIDGKHVIRYRTQYIHEEYTLECSPDLVRGLNGVTARELVSVVKRSAHGQDVVPLLSVIDPAEAKLADWSAENLIRALCHQLFSGFYHVDAIRLPCRVGNLEQLEEHLRELQERDNSSIDPKKAMEQGYVGRQGEAAWLLERRFARTEMCPSGSGESFASKEKHYFEGFVSYWTEKLCQARIVLSESGQSLSDAWQSEQDPTGFLSSLSPVADDPGDSRDNSDTLARIEHDCVKEISWPSRMSSGFHQLFPLIVQTGLMGPQAVLAIENPEVHLHPSLQVALAEFILQQANAGKWFLIETHSDLIISRVLLELLEERIGMGQERIRIYFSHLEPKAEESPLRWPKVGLPAYSCLREIEVDEEGRVANWPAGFMNDHLKLSGRLFDVMYGVQDDSKPDAGTHHESNE
jgi:hypothetical protein